MKARLYRGPHDGKVIPVRDKQPYIELNEIADIDWSSAKMPNDPISVVSIVYKNTGLRHPDGSVFFEWDKPRGSRSGVKSKKPKKQKFATGGYITTMPINTGTITYNPGPYSISTI